MVSSCRAGTSHSVMAPRESSSSSELMRTRRVHHAAELLQAANERIGNGLCAATGHGPADGQSGGSEDESDGRTHRPIERKQ